MHPAPPTHTPQPRPRQRTAVIVSSIAALVVVGVIALAAFTAVPPILANLASEPSDGQTPVTLEAGAASADVVVPSGWIVVRDSAASVLVRTPDAQLTARIDLVDETADAALAAEPELSSPVRAEVLASGRDVVHADLASGGVAAAVPVLGAGMAPSVRVVASTADTALMPDYRPALAQLLDGIAP